MTRSTGCLGAPPHHAGRLMRAAAMGWVLAWPLPCLAGPSQSGALLLQQPFGARPFAMGQAYAALGDDIFAMSYNPASLSRLKQSQAAANFTQSIADSKMGYLGLASPLNPSQALGLAVKYMDLGTGDIFNSNGSTIRTVQAQRDYMIQFGYAARFQAGSGNFHLGASAKALNSVIAQDMRATAYGADVGAIYERPWLAGTASAAASLLNAGPGIRYSGGVASDSSADRLPLTSRFAAGYSHNVFGSDDVSLGLELDHAVHDSLLTAAVGVEYDYHRLCALRFGYRSGQDLGGLTMGLGLRLKDMSIDYGIGLLQTFDSVQQMSLTYRFEIPGIRYDRAGPPSPIESMAKEIETAIKAGRLFDASAGRDRLLEFFPTSMEGAFFSRRLEQEVEAILSQGPLSQRLEYAQGLQQFEQRQWQKALESLEVAGSREPDNDEIAKYLARAKKRVDEQNLQLRLRTQARIGTLFELANQAFEGKDYDRANRILDAILRLGPYQPAKSLKRRIAEARTRRVLAPAAVEPPRRAAPATAPQPTSPEDIQKADYLFRESIRAYGEGRLDEALSNLKRARQLDPANTLIRNFLESVEKELKQQSAPGRP
ncbi:MAG TPA: hypothetical protein DEB40_06305 [Elusimicrobia bacterium]|nr:hypothetical protein [Elusimicrobiota bacterium]HBT61339.1 hypothetical protein [Elusimicrobiota bacterium]